MRRTRAAGSWPAEGEDIRRHKELTMAEIVMAHTATKLAHAKGRVRAFGRVWDFDGRSAEICQIDWKGPR